MSLYGQVKELRSKRAKIVKEAGDILQGAQKENRAMSADENARFEKAHTDADALRTQIEQIERQMDAEKDALRALGDQPPVQNGAAAGQTVQASAERRQAIEREAFRAFVTGRPMAGDDEHVAEIRSMIAEGFASGSDFINASRLSDSERRNLSAVTGNLGAYTIPQGFYPELERAMKQFGGMLRVASIIPTDSGSELPWPTVNDANNKGEQVDEGTATTGSTEATKDDANPAFDRVLLKAYLFSSKALRLPITLLQDSAFSLDTMVNEWLAERIGRILNEKFTTGAGTTTPKGIVTAATAGHTSQAPNALSYTQDLLPLEHSVDPAYREGGRGRWMFNDSTLLSLKKMTDGTGRLLWQAGVAQGAPDTLDGFPYTVNQDMASIGAGAKPVLFGDLSKYKARMVRQVALVRLVERYAEFFEIGFIAYLRADGNLIDAGTHPVKYLTMHA